jgi:hypothetical protein
MKSLRRRQALLRWRVYSGWLVVCVAGFVGPVMAIRSLGWGWGGAVSYLLLLSLHPVVTRLLPNWTRRAQDIRTAWLFVQAKNEDHAAVLLLRSFSSPITVNPEPTIRSHPINQPDSPAAARSNVLRVAHGLRGLGPAIAIGFPRRGIRSALTLDALMLQPDEHHWFQVFEMLSESSRVVVALPGESPSVTREWRSLVERALVKKTVIVMPPHGHGLAHVGRRGGRESSLPWRRSIRRWRIRVPGVDDHLDTIRDGWQAAREHFAEELTIDLPPYDPGGLALTLDSNGRVMKTVELYGSFVYLERAIRELVPPEVQGNMPLGPVMRRLNDLGLAP